MTFRVVTGRWSVRWTTTRARAAIGTPTKKHQRQPSQLVSTMTPPMSGPAIVARDITAAIGPV